MSQKSGKREVAGLLLLLWTALVIRVFWFIEDPETLGEILMGLTVWIVPPALAVFGFHHYSTKKPDDPTKG